MVEELEKLIELAKQFDYVNDFEDYPSYPTYNTYDNYDNPCAHCSNNPLINKFASGICNCVLPYLNNPTY